MAAVTPALLSDLVGWLWSFTFPSRDGVRLA